MASYYLDSNPNLPNNGCDIHRVCPEGCPNLPALAERINLGDLPDSKTAIHVARRKFYNHAHIINGCEHCTNSTPHETLT